MKTSNLIPSAWLGLAVVLAIPYFSSAAIIAEDTFNYSAGPLTGANGGNGWAAGWLAPVGSPQSLWANVTNAPALSFSPLGGQPVHGGPSNVVAWATVNGGTGNNPVTGRQLATPLSKTFYVAYLLRYQPTGTAVFDGNNTFTLHLSSSASSTASFNFGIRCATAAGDTNNPAYGGKQFLVRHGTGGVLSSQYADAATGGLVGAHTNYYLVAKLNYNAAANSGAGGFDSIHMWLDPNYPDEAAYPQGEARLTQSGTVVGSVSHLFWREAAINNIGPTSYDMFAVDKLVIGETWDDVVAPSGPPIPMVRVETAADGSGAVVAGQTLTAGATFQVYAIARDASGVFLSNAPAVWSLQNVTGGVVAGDLVPSDDEKSAVFNARLSGSVVIRGAAYATTLVDSGVITVQAGPAVTINVETAPDGTGTIVPSQFLPVGMSVSAYAVTRDAGGNFLQNVSATWSLQNRSGGVVAGDLTPANGSTAMLVGNLSGTATIRAILGSLTPVESGLITISRPVTWVGDGSQNKWDYTSMHWSSGSPTKFYDQDDVTFDSTGSRNPPVNITTEVQPHSVIVDGAYTLTGAGGIAGAAAITNRTDKLTLLNTNSYTGPTVVEFGGSLQLGNGIINGSLGTGPIIIGTGATSPIFNRTDSVSAPYVVSNTISGPSDFVIEVKSGAVKLAGPGGNTHATALVRNGATLILGKDNNGGPALGASTFVSGTVLNIETGGKVVLDSTVVDHITGAGKVVQIDGTFDVNGNSEAFGVIQGNGVIDNSGSNSAVLTINQGSAAFGHLNEVFTFAGQIRNTGTGVLGLTKDGTNTLVLGVANTYRGDTRIVGGGVLELGHPNAMQYSTADLRTGDTGTLSFGTLTTVTMGALAGNKSLELANTSGAAVALTIGKDGGTNTYSGGLSGAGSLTKTGIGVQTLTGANTYTGNTTIAGGTLVVNGALGNGSVSVSTAGALGGTGIIGGPVMVNGKLILGSNGVGKLTVNNTVSLAGTTIVQLSGTNCGQLAANAISLGGSLVVTNAGDAVLPGTTYKLFTGALSGTMTVASLPLVPTGATWDTSRLNSEGTITLNGLLAPPSMQISISGSQLVLSAAGGIPGSTFYTRATNNLTAPMELWPRMATNVFGPDGRFTINIPVNPSAAQSYFRLEIP